MVDMAGNEKQEMLGLKQMDAAVEEQSKHRHGYDCGPDTRREMGAVLRDVFNRTLLSKKDDDRRERRLLFTDARQVAGAEENKRKESRQCLDVRQDCGGRR
jgi:hypothetical protein